MTKPTARSRRWNVPVGSHYEVTITINAEHRLVISRYDNDPGPPTPVEVFTCSPIDAANLAIALQQAAALASVAFAKQTKAKVLGGFERFADMVIGATKGGR